MNIDVWNTIKSDAHIIPVKEGSWGACNMCRGGMYNNVIIHTADYLPLVVHHTSSTYPSLRTHTHTCIYPYAIPT